MRVSMKAHLENHQWSTAVDLPESLQYHSATVYATAISYTCWRECTVIRQLNQCTHVQLVLLFRRPFSIYKCMEYHNCWSSSYRVYLCDLLWTAPGEEYEDKPTTAVYMYNPSTNSWSVINHMMTAKISPFAERCSPQQPTDGGGRGDELRRNYSV